MATVNILAGLLLLGCLISAVTSSPIKGKEDPIVPRPSRFLRIKTITRVTQIPESALSSNGRIYPNQSPAQRFGSNLSLPPVTHNEQSQFTQRKGNGYISPQSGNQEGSNLPIDQTKENHQVPETVSSPGRHSHLPAITNFGARIQKNDQNSKQPGCQVKGACSTVNFTPNGQIPIEGVTKIDTTFERDSQRPSVSSHDQQEQFAGQDQPHRQEAFGSGQSIDSGDYYDKNSVNSQSEEERKRTEQFPEQVNVEIVSNQGSVQNDFQPETQLTAQQDSSDFSNGQNFEGSFQTQEKDRFSGPSKQSTSNSVLPVQQTSVDSGTDYEEQRNFVGNSQFDQSTSQGESHDSSRNFAGNSQFDQSTSQGASHDSSRNFAGNSQFDQSTSQGASYDSQNNFAGNTQFDQSNSQGASYDSQRNFVSHSQFDQSTSQGTSYDSQNNFAGNTQFDQSNSQGASYESQSNFAGNTQFDQSNSQGANYDSQRNFIGNSQFDQSTSIGSFDNDQKPQISGVQTGSFESGHQNSDDGQYHQYADPIEGLRYNVPGNPGEDYPILYQVPETSFNCKDQPFSAGIFGDTEASCQVFHVCKENGGQASFLCPNGTVFNQKYFVCDWWYNFRCSDTPSFYNLNNELYWDWDSFTPSQMLNVPSGNAENSNLQSGTQGSFGSNEDIPLGAGEIGNQRDPFRSTTPIDNSAVRDENQNIYEQTYEDAFAQRESIPPSAGNVFQNTQQGVYDQNTNVEYPSSFTPDVGVPTRGLDLTTISPISDRVENTPEFKGNANDQNDNSYKPVSSDNGYNRESGGDSGTRYPDQQGHVPQSNGNIQSLDQNRPLFDSQRNVGNSNSNEEVLEEKYNEQELVSSDFGNGNDFRGSNSGSVQNNQNNYGTGSDEGIRSHNNQQILSDISNNGGSYITQTKVQEESLPNSSDNEKPQVFNPNGNGNVQGNQEIFGTQDQRPLSDNNQGDNINQQVVQEEFSSSFGSNSDFSGKRDESYNQQFSENQGFPIDVNQQSGVRNDQNSHNRNSDDFSNVQQQHISNTFGDNVPDSFQNDNSGAFGPQSQNTFTQDHTATSLGAGISENLGNSRSVTTPNIHQNQGVQQEHIPSTFDDQNNAFTSGENYDTSKTFESGQQEVSRSITTSEGVLSNDGNYNTQNVDGNQPLQQEQVSAFSGNSRDSVFRVMDNRGDYEKNSNRQISGQEVSEAHNALNNANKNSGNPNVGTRPNIQQEYITSWDNNNPSSFASGQNIGSERDISNQRQTTTPFQPNDQNPFNSDGRQQFQNTGGNQEIQQEHVSVHLNGFRQNVVGNDGSNVNNILQEEFLTTFNRGSTAHDNNQRVSFGSTDTVDRNNPQLTEQQHISTHFGEDRPTDYEMNKETVEKNRPTLANSNAGGSNSFTGANEDIQQHSLSIPFNGNTRDDFYPGNNRAQNGLTLIRDQTNIPSISTVQNNNDRGQNFESIHFEQNPVIEDRQNERPVISSENTGYQKATNNDVNSQNNFGSADFTREGNPTNTPEIQQEHIVSTFNGPQSNAFDSSGNGRNRIMQNGYINVPGPDQFNGQNNFRVSINNQQNSPGVRNIQQENIPASFENNHQTNFHRVSTFQEERRQENLAQHNQFVSTVGDQNSFEVGPNNGGHLNPTQAFQTRLNNFRPVQIHMMNRGGFQNRNYDQQRLSFRPYGQNNQNAVIFPGSEIPVNFVQNPSLGLKGGFSNDRSPSNHNFFVTNGHQLREEHSQLQTGNRPHSNQGPENNIQADRRESGQQNIKRTNQEVLNSGSGAIDSKNDNKAIHQSDVSHTASNSARVDNRNVNSGVKGSSSQNYRNGKNVNISPSSNVEIDLRGSPVNAADAMTYNSPIPESPTSMNYNGWKPVVKY